MNYEPNTTKWKVGDIIIHDADAKREDMLMRVIEIKQNSVGQLRYVCEYISKAHHMYEKGLNRKEFDKWNKWENSVKPLHDPKRFNISTPAKR